jgi:Ethanolamine utilization protein EutJ (predicted chaperonin)
LERAGYAGSFDPSRCCCCRRRQTAEQAEAQLRVGTRTGTTDLVGILDINTAPITATLGSSGQLRSAG